MGRAIKNWIQGAIKNPGSLKKALNVPKDKDIPAKKLEKALHSKSRIMRERANLAKNLKSFHQKGS